MTAFGGEESLALEDLAVLGRPPTLEGRLPSAEEEDGAAEAAGALEADEEGRLIDVFSFFARDLVGGRIMVPKWLCVGALAGGRR